MVNAGFLSSVSRLEVACKCGSVSQGVPLGWGISCLPCRETRKLGFALWEGCSPTKSGAANAKNCIMIYLKFSLILPEFEWEWRGRHVAAEVGIPTYFWKHPEMTICDALGDTVHWGPLWVSSYCSFHSLANSGGSHLTGLVLFA